MEIRNIHQDSGWYASYMDSTQGKALVECQSQKIKQLTKVIEKIKYEVENNEGLIIEKLEIIKSLCSDIPEVEVRDGYFKWNG
jgi:hypothetical protein